MEKLKKEILDFKLEITPPNKISERLLSNIFSSYYRDFDEETLNKVSLICKAISNIYTKTSNVSISEEIHEFKGPFDYYTFDGFLLDISCNYHKLNIHPETINVSMSKENGMLLIDNLNKKFNALGISFEEDFTVVMPGEIKTKLILI